MGAVKCGTCGDEHGHLENCPEILNNDPAYMAYLAEAEAEDDMRRFGRVLTPSERDAQAEGDAADALFFGER